jgi:hypothetical protein
MGLLALMRIILSELKTIVKNFNMSDAKVAAWIILAYSFSGFMTGIA